MYSKYNFESQFKFLETTGRFCDLNCVELIIDHILFCLCIIHVLTFSDFFVFMHYVLCASMQCAWNKRQEFLYPIQSVPWHSTLCPESLMYMYCTLPSSVPRRCLAFYVFVTNPKGQIIPITPWASLIKVGVWVYTLQASKCVFFFLEKDPFGLFQGMFRSYFLNSTKHVLKKSLFRGKLGGKIAGNSRLGGVFPGEGRWRLGFWKPLVTYVYNNSIWVSPPPPG